MSIKQTTPKLIKLLEGWGTTPDSSFYNWYANLEQQERENKGSPRYIITFNDFPGWRINVYHDVKLLLKIFQPDGRIYGAYIMKGHEWDETVMGAMDHYMHDSEIADKMATHSNHMIFPMSLKDKPKEVEELMKKYKMPEFIEAKSVPIFVPETYDDCPCTKCNNEYGIIIETAYKPHGAIRNDQ